MRKIILLVMTTVLVGCGKKDSETLSETKGKAGAAAKIPANALVNSLGMPFVPVPGTEVQFCIWETRVKDYAAFATAKAGVDGSWKYPKFMGKSFTREETHPVVMVSWEDAVAFCEWLTKKELAEGKIKAGQKYRLPTDVEWSVAVGLGQEKGNTPKEKDGGIRGVYPWGKKWPPPARAGNHGESLKVDKFDHTSPVGSFAANQFGIHDMGGNVWEWCEDRWNPTSTRRVFRGASWIEDYPSFLVSSYRGTISTVGRDYGGVGFRCVLVGGSGG